VTPTRGQQLGLLGVLALLAVLVARQMAC